MARIRTIKPEFWTDEKLVECSRDARLLFIGLLNFADDNGNLIESSVRIKMQIFPADTIEVIPLINDLITHGLLTEYSVNGTKYLHIKGFKAHQVINRPSKSAIPEPTLTEDSLTEGKGKERKGKEEEKSTKKENKNFDEFWNSFPTQRKGNREKAEAAYRQALTRSPVEEILAGLKSYLDSDEVKRGFAKGAAAWLNDDRWKTDYTKGNSHANAGANTAQNPRPGKSERARAAILESAVELGYADPPTPGTSGT